MRYSLEPKYRKYVHGYGFLSFARTFGNKYGKKLINTGINSARKFSNSKYGKEIKKKQGINFTRTAGERVLKNSAETTGNLIGNKIADKITSLGNQTNENEINKEQEEIIIPPEKRQQIINNLRLF